MTIARTFKEQCVFSFEVFPPHKKDGIETIKPVLADLAALNPDYMSVTLGAGGNAALRQNTIEVVDILQNEEKIPAVAHLPAVNFSRTEVNAFLETLKQRGITRVLALRGDKTPNQPPKTDFPYAANLIDFIRQHQTFCIGAACYPETHLEAVSAKKDLYYLKQKVDAGVDYLISQLFFDNQKFFDFIEKTQQIGIRVPIQAGVMPVTNLQQAKHITKLTEVKFPTAMTNQLERYANDAGSLRQAGLDFANQQIQQLVEQGVAGVHLYTMNAPSVAKAICEQSRHLFNAAKNNNLESI